MKKRNAEYALQKEVEKEDSVENIDVISTEVESV